MEKPKRIVKPFASALSLAYDRVIRAREQIEHRLVTIPRQEKVVLQWTENLLETAAAQYPGQDVLSYPVQTRMQHDIEKLERYRRELQDGLSRYSAAMQEVDRTVEYIITATNSGLFSGDTVRWPTQPNELLDDPWPSHWPPDSDLLAGEMPGEFAYSFNNNRPLPLQRQRSPTSFTLEIADQEILLHALYKDGVECFKIALDSFFNGQSSSRWPAIIEAIRCGISWPQLDRYLAECNKPWLPTELVCAEFGLRGTLTHRDQLADFLSKISPDAGRWYLSSSPGLHMLGDSIENHSIYEELMAVGLVLWGPHMPLNEVLRYVPFLELKSLFALAALPPPRGFDNAVERYGELVSAYGEDCLRSKIRYFVDISKIIEVREVEGWNREDRLGPRARANVLVSTLVLLQEYDKGPFKVLKWGS